MDRYYVLDTGNIRSRNTYTREETVLGTWTIHEMYLADEVDTALAKKKEEIARLIQAYNKAVDPLEQDVKRLREEIARLRKALGFYGDKENYDMREICWAPGHMCVRKEIESDRGSVAREALER